ncbi:unnamed protein product, partial [Meganyctiphanes norvegica]
MSEKYDDLEIVSGGLSLAVQKGSSESGSSLQLCRPVRHRGESSLGGRIRDAWCIYGPEAGPFESRARPPLPKAQFAADCRLTSRAKLRGRLSVNTKCGVEKDREECEKKRETQNRFYLKKKPQWNPKERKTLSLYLVNPKRANYGILRVSVHLRKKYIERTLMIILIGSEEVNVRFDEIKGKDQHRNVAKIIKSKLCLDIEDVEEKVIKIMGIYDTSCFDVPFSSDDGEQDTWGRAMFPGTAMMNHSCVPNTHNTFSPTDKCMLIRASENIPKGTPICISYSKTKLMWGNRMRREYLEYKWFFTCNCSRCKDPTELGSNLSSVKCKFCNGLVVPHYNEYDTLWTCNNCHKTVSDRAVEAALSLLGTSFAKVSHNNVKALQRAIIVIDKILGPQIFLNVAFKHQIVKAIMNRHTEDCSLTELWCVVDMTSFLLDVADKLAPGMSYLRGDMMYKHIRAALEILLRAKNYQTENVSTIDDNKILNGNINDMHESSISHTDAIDSDVTANNASGNEPMEIGNKGISLLLTDSKSLKNDDRLKLRWKELDVKVLLERTKEAKEILKYSFYARDILPDTDNCIEAFQELMQT